MAVQVSSKIGVIESLLSKCDKLVIGGGMVFTFLKVMRPSRKQMFFFSLASTPVIL